MSSIQKQISTNIDKRKILQDIFQNIDISKVSSIATLNDTQIELLYNGLKIKDHKKREEYINMIEKKYADLMHDVSQTMQEVYKIKNSIREVKSVKKDKTEILNLENELANL